MARTLMQRAAGLIDRAQRIAERSPDSRIRSLGDSIVLAHGWTEAEGDTDAVIVLCDWNHVANYGEPKRPGQGLFKRLGEMLERIGVEVLWSDQHDLCITCQRVMTTEPDCHSWRPQYVFVDGEGYECSACTTADRPDEYLDELAHEGAERIPVDEHTLFGLEPDAHGWTLVEKRDVGFYAKTDDVIAREIATPLRADGKTVLVVRVRAEYPHDYALHVWVKDEDE